MPPRKPRCTTTIAGVNLNNLSLSINEPHAKKEFDDLVVKKVNDLFWWVQPYSILQVLVGLVDILMSGTVIPVAICQRMISFFCLTILFAVTRYRFPKKSFWVFTL